MTSYLLRVTSGVLLLLFTMSQLPAQASPPIDRRATKQTRALLANLQQIAPRQTLFGQQDALAYGVTWRDYHPWRSDVQDVSGMSPAVFGWDISKLGQRDINIDTIPFARMKGWMKEVFKRGGVNTISWHTDNFVTGGSSWDTEGRVVATILPEGRHHADYVAKLDLFADFIRELRSGFIFKKDVPVIFRPFHEHTGSWFWWGEAHCTTEEYLALWHFTVEYLRDEKGLHNLLYAYSPDIVGTREEYLERYPGDGYVDIIGIDNYQDFKVDGNIDDAVKRLRLIVEIADEKGKVAALTETGIEAIPEADWWTKKFLYALTSDPVASRIAWAMVWRNSRPTHHYGPYPGHVSAADFKNFSAVPEILFQEELPDMYRRNRP